MRNDGNRIAYGIENQYVDTHEIILICGKKKNTVLVSEDWLYGDFAVRNAHLGGCGAADAADLRVI